MRKSLGLSLLAVCFLVLQPEYSAEAIAEEDDPVIDSSETFEENAYAEVHSALFFMADQVDAFFGDVRTIEQRGSDWFRAGVAGRLHSGGDSSLNKRIGASINLSGVSENLQLVVLGSGSSDGEFSGNSSRTDSLSDLSGRTTDDTVSSYLRLNFWETYNFRLQFDGGVRFRSGLNPNPFVRSRLSRWFELGSDWAVEPQFALRLEREDKFVQQLRLDLNKRFGRTLMRLRTEGTHYQEESGIDFLEELAFYRPLSRRSFIGTYLSYFLPNDDSPDRFRSSMRLRRQAWYEWFFVEVEPGLDFLQDRDYDPRPFIVVRLDVYFDRGTRGLQS